MRRMCIPDRTPAISTLFTGKTCVRKTPSPKLSGLCFAVGLALVCAAMTATSIAAGPGVTETRTAEETPFVVTADMPSPNEEEAYLAPFTVEVSSRPGIRFAKGVLIVRLSDELSPVVAEGRPFTAGETELDRVLYSHGLLGAERLFPWDCGDRRGGECNVLRLKFPDDADLEGLIDLLAATPGVAGVDPVGVHLVHHYPDDTNFPYQWALNQRLDHDVNAPEAWDVERGDSSVVVAVVDTGVDWQHPDLGGSSPYTGGNIWTNWAEAFGSPGVDDDVNGFVDDVRGWDFVTGVGAYVCSVNEDGEVPDNDPADFFGHGTHVSGIAAAVTDNSVGVAGLAHGCKIMPVRAGWCLFTGGAPAGVVRMDFCAQGIMYAARNGARVINCSWDSDSGVNGWGAVDTALARGVIIVVSAGNSSNSSQRFNYLSTRTQTFAVASVDSNDVKAASSNYGTWVDFCAPGEFVLSTFYRGFPTPQRGYAWMSGTSMAAPFVSGLSALLLSQEPSLTWQGVHDRIASTCVYIDTLNESNCRGSTCADSLGAGRIDAYAALSVGSGNWQGRTAGVVRGSPLPITVGLNRCVAVTSSDGCLHVMTASGGYSLGWPRCLPGSPTSPAAGNLDADTALELVAATDSGYVCVWDLDGDAVSGWPVRLPAGVTSGPMLADLDGDAALEIICGTSDMSLHVLEGNGTAWPGPVDLSGYVSSEPCFAAVGIDTSYVILMGTSDSRLHAIKEDGTYATGWPVTLGLGMFRSPAAVDFDADGRSELLAGDSDGYVYALDDLGSGVSGWPRSAGGALTRSLALGDMDADTIPEVVAACMDGAIYAWKLNGDIMPGWPVYAGDSVWSSPSLSDLTGDGRCEVAVGSDDGYLYVWTSSGALLPGWPRSTGGAVRSSPCFFDFDKDGELEVAVGSDDRKLHFWKLPGADEPESEVTWPMYRHDAQRTGNSGLKVMAPVRPPKPGLVVTTSPNPFGGSLESVEIKMALTGQSVSTGEKRGLVRIYDTQGRLVAELSLRGEGSEFVLSWDGGGASERKVGSGVYFYKAELEGFSAEGKLVFLKK